MNVALISASSRADSQSDRICDFIDERFFDASAPKVKLCEQVLPLWDGKSFSHPTVKAIRETLRAADAFVLVVPEWNGMAPAAIKNLFLWASHREFAHKPCLLVAISAGSGGAMVIHEMRSSSYKNSRVLYLPEHLILRDVESLWQSEEAGSDHYLLKRLDYCMDMLCTYARAMPVVRDRMLPQLELHQNGMS